MPRGETKTPTNLQVVGAKKARSKRRENSGAKTAASDRTSFLPSKSLLRGDRHRTAVESYGVVFDPDAEFLAAAEAQLGPAPDPRLGHHVIAPGDLRAAVCGTSDDVDGDLSPEEAQRISRLRKLSADPDLLWKRHLVADGVMIEKLRAVAEAAPNAGQAVDVVVRAAALSHATVAPMAVPPIVLLGPPGGGKTFLARELGRAIGLPTETFLASTMADGSPLLGAGTGWKGGGPGKLARLLLHSSTSSPIVFCDEIEKMKLWDRREHAADILLGLLDRGTATAFEDLYYRVPMRADRVIWLLAANDLDELSRPFLDRCLVVDVGPPTQDQRRAIARRVFDETCDRLGVRADFALAESDAGLLDDIGLRRLGLALQLAIGRAVEAGRDRLDAADLRWAREAVACGGERRRQAVGFVVGDRAKT